MPSTPILKRLYLPGVIESYGRCWSKGGMPRSEVLKDSSGDGGGPKGEPETRVTPGAKDRMGDNGNNNEIIVELEITAHINGPHKC